MNKGRNQGLIVALLATLVVASSASSISAQPITPGDARTPLRSAILPKGAKDAGSTSQGAASSGPLKTEITTFESWSVNCDNRGTPPATRRCLAKTSVVDATGPAAGSTKVVLNLTIGKSDLGRWRIWIQSPTSLVLNPGVNLALGKNAPRRLEPTSCEPSSCLAEAPFDPAFAAEMSNADTAVVTWTTLHSGDARVEFGLKGAKAALAHLFEQ